MHNKALQNVQNDLECVGCYQGEGEKHHKKAAFYFFSNPVVLFDNFGCDSGQKNLCRLGKTVTQQFGNANLESPLSCMKPKNLTFVGFWTQIFRRK